MKERGPDKQAAKLFLSIMMNTVSPTSLTRTLASGHDPGVLGRGTGHLYGHHCGMPVVRQLPQACLGRAKGPLSLKHSFSSDVSTLRITLADHTAKISTKEKRVCAGMAS